MICANGRLPRCLHGYDVARLSLEPQVSNCRWSIIARTRAVIDHPFGLPVSVLRSQSMKLSKIAVSMLILVTMAVPAMASSDWVEDFLRRYDPTKSVTTV